MPSEEDDDLYDEEFDFVDEDDSEEEEQAADEDSENGEEAPGEDDADRERGEGEEDVDEYGRPAPQANYVVHVYEHKKFKRTIDRAFTPEARILTCADRGAAGRRTQRPQPA